MKVLPRRGQEENLNLLEDKAEDVPLRLMLKRTAPVQRAQRTASRQRISETKAR
jgi:hypothetical protein